MRILLLVVLLIAVLALLGAAYVRLAPSDAAQWHVDPATGADGTASVLRRSEPLALEPAAALTAVAQAAPPRTRILAGTPESGRMTFVTRSKWMGFPDYTTVAAEAGTGGTVLTLYGRSRFGKYDLGVNEARVAAWLRRLGAEGS